MKVPLLSALMIAVMSLPAASADISSAYTDLDSGTDCTVFAAAEAGDGEWANLVCNGYRGYPVFLFAGDLRESLFYGFPPSGDLAPAWESFSAFNSAGPRIEWRLEARGDNIVPFATIHRRSVSSDDGERSIEVLAVSKVGQPDTREGCVVGLVLATGHPEANTMARKLADEHVRGFACGTDQMVSVGSPMPDFGRSD